jgi:hypothetical protein
MKNEKSKWLKLEPEGQKPQIEQSIFVLDNGIPRHAVMISDVECKTDDNYHHFLSEFTYWADFSIIPLPKE